MYEKNTGNASPFASLSGRCLLCPVCRAAGVGRCGAFAPCGPKPPPAEVRRCGRVPQTSTRRYGAADLRVGILPEESISSVVYFFLLCFWLDPKAPKDQARRKVGVPPPALAERAQKTALFCTPAPGARAAAVTASAIFAVRSRRPETCHVRTQTNNHRCVQRAAASALRKVQRAASPR